VNVTEIVQLSFGASVFGDSGQLEVWAKSPEIEMLLIASAAVVVFLRTTVLGVLVVCTTQFPKLTLAGVRVCAVRVRAEQENSVNASSPCGQVNFKPMAP